MGGADSSSPDKSMKIRRNDNEPEIITPTRTRGGNYTGASRGGADTMMTRGSRGSDSMRGSRGSGARGNDHRHYQNHRDPNEISEMNSEDRPH